MDEWVIDKPLGKCAATGKQIEPGEEYYATLVETEQGFARRDFCTDYWNQNKPRVFCYWKTRLPSPDQKKHLFIDDDMLMAFFERLATETEQEKVNFRFVLALVLMRRRRLKYDSSKNEEGKDIWRLRKTSTHDFVEVVNPNLDESQVAQLTSQIGQILQVELEEAK
ncbi:MAG: hypothetical protein JW749_09945 [Sedimentisphaerales bacterium]|nr:hypothetical protein [Sedimentisphaerales bacterium]